MLQPLDEDLVFLLRHPALLRGLLRADLVALGGRSFEVPLKRVAAREVVATVVAEMDLKRVRLCGLAVSLELFKVLELGVWAEATLDRLDRPTRDVGLRSQEERPILWLEDAGDNE